MSAKECCSVCGEWCWLDLHSRHLPKWKGWVDGYGDEDNPDEVYATDAEAAAEQLCQNLIDGYAGEISAAQRFEVFMFIDNEEENGMPKVKKFEVTGEYTVSWSTYEAE